jgi:hypothetical protein
LKELIATIAWMDIMEKHANQFYALTPPEAVASAAMVKTETESARHATLTMTLPRTARTVLILCLGLPATKQSPAKTEKLLQARKAVATVSKGLVSQSGLVSIVISVTQPITERTVQPHVPVNTEPATTLKPPTVSASLEPACKTTKDQTVTNVQLKAVKNAFVPMVLVMFQVVRTAIDTAMLGHALATSLVSTVINANQGSLDQNVT